jgi:RNA polymerase sigma-70 factor, ECF subfamily
MNGSATSGPGGVTIEGGGGVLGVEMEVAQRVSGVSGRYPVPPVEPVRALGHDARPDLQEQELLRRVHQGDELAFSRLFEQHWDGVARLLTRLLGDPEPAGDVAQEVFVQLFRKPPALGEGPLRAWLFRVALNRGYNALRADRRRRTREDAVARDPSAPAGGDAGVLEEANRAEERDLVRRALLRLPERQRECLLLRAEGLSYSEVAAALGVAPGSVGTLLARAERAFKEIYRAQRGGM